MTRDLLHSPLLEEILKREKMSSNCHVFGSFIVKGSSITRTWCKNLKSSDVVGRWHFPTQSETSCVINPFTFYARSHRCGFLFGNGTISFRWWLSSSQRVTRTEPRVVSARKWWVCTSFSTRDQFFTRDKDTNFW